MTPIKVKVQTGLDESRTLILGAQVLIGFQYNSFFQPGFEKLTPLSQQLKIISLGLLLLTFVLLVAPAAFHCLVEENRDTPEVQNYITRAVEWALLPFSVGMGLDLYTLTHRLVGTKVAVLLGTGSTLTALFFWYGLEWTIRSRVFRPSRDNSLRKSYREDLPALKNQEQPSDAENLKDKIQHVLTESRMVLPGAQALLGFQFTIFLMQAYEKLPHSSKLMHLASLLFIALSTVLLMAPAAYHRIVDEGETTERLHRFASAMNLSALVFLALGMAGDLVIVVRKVTGSESSAWTAGIGLLILCYGIWFGYSLACRDRRRIRSHIKIAQG